MSEVVILQHVANENAGTILAYLKRHHIPFRQVNLFEEPYTLPPLTHVRALVVMGGPMNVYEEEKYPFLTAENLYIQEAVRRGIPFLGICLGSQLLAKALGAKVMKAPVEEIGWDTVDLRAAAGPDPVFGALGLKRMKVLQWHGDTFELPKNAVHLAQNLRVPHQAYAVHGRSYGLQFHLEVDRPMIEDWFKKRDDLSKILEEYDAYHEELSGLTERFYREFFKLSAGR